MTNIFELFCVILCSTLGFNTNFVLSARDYKLEFKRVESVPGKTITLIDFSDYKIVQRANINYIEGNITFLEDINNSITVDVAFEYSALNNNQFFKHPYRLRNLLFCNFLRDIYRPVYQDTHDGKSTLPNIPPEGLCPLPKGTYQFSEFRDMKLMPEHLPLGMWKVIPIFKFKGERVGTLQVYILLTQRKH